MGSCTLSPLQSRIAVGEDPFILFVAEGVNGDTDLFAVGSNGGRVTRVTFTPLIESAPALTTVGGLVAFIRVRDTMPTAVREVVVMNLINGAERVLAMPTDAGRADKLAWFPDETGLYVQTDRGTWRAMAPPSEVPPTPITAAEQPAADSAFTVRLGRPAFARATACDSGGVCVIGPSGVPSRISTVGTGALSWGADSIAWWDGDVLVVRGLGPGPQRRVEWAAGEVRNPREASYASPE